MTRTQAGIEGPAPDRIGEALSKQQEIFRDTFPGALGVRVDEVRDGYARASMAVDGRVRNPGGVAHGGALAGFGDTVAAWATFPSLGPQESFTTIDFKASFLAPVSDGRVVGEASVVHRGRRTVVLDVKIRTDDPAQRLLCVMLVTQAIIRAEGGTGSGRY